MNRYLNYSVVFFYNTQLKCFMFINRSYNTNANIYDNNNTFYYSNDGDENTTISNNNDNNGFTFAKYK